MLRSIRIRRIAPLFIAALLLFCTTRSLSARPIPSFGPGGAVSDTPDTGSEAMSQLLKQQLAGGAAAPNCAGQLGLANVALLGSLGLLGLGTLKRHLPRG